MAKEESKEETETSSEQPKGEAEESKTDESKGDAEAPDEGEPESPKESSTEDDEPSQEDWKKIALENEEARKKAERALAEKRFKSSEAKRQGEEDDEEAEEIDDEPTEKPLTRSEVQEIIQASTEATRKEVLATQAKEIARGLAGSNEEAEAIMAIYNARSLPGSLEDQITEAFYIAHGPRLTAKLSEARRSLRSKETKKRGGSENTYRDAPEAEEPKMSAQDKAEFKRLGYKWDGKRYSKKLSTGKILAIDPVTKRPIVVGS